MTQSYSLEKHKSDQLDLKLRRESLRPLVLKVLKIKYVKAEALVRPLENVLQQSASEGGADIRGSISTDESSNTIIINAPEAELRKLIDLVDIIDRKTRQVRIEATLVEVSSSLAVELGVKWSMHMNQSLNGTSETRDSTALSPMTMDEDGTFSLPTATYHTLQGLIDTETGSVDYGVIGENFALGMNLTALEEAGKLKILSRPSLTTMDNSKAVIKSGSDIPFSTEDEDGRSVVEYKEAVLSLSVRPQIVDDIAIFMDVAITKDEPDFSQSVDGNPLVLKKFVETRMMVLDGQTAVIGGLSKASSFNSDGGIAILKDLPFIGKLFSSKSKQDSDEELMIFLTPRIVPNSDLDNSELIKEWMQRHYYGDAGDPAQSAIQPGDPAQLGLGE
jgi:type IV pilus assembly protein PilQ